MNAETVTTFSPECIPGAPLLSVVIVTYRSAADIGPCLRSLPRQLEGRAVEVIVVDNASPDATVAVIQAEAPWVRCVPAGGNLGFSRANNIGAGLAAGDYILFLNPDTVANVSTLAACLGRLRQESDIGIISPRLVLADGQMDLACRRSIPTAWDGFTRAMALARRFPRTRWFAGYNLTYLPDGGTYDVGAVNGAFMMLSRRHLARIGLFDERFFMYGDDLDLCYRCTLAGLRVVYDGRYTITHLKGQSSAQSYEAMSREVFRATKAFYLKHFNPGRSLLRKWKYDILFGAWERLAGVQSLLYQRKSARPM